MKLKINKACDLNSISVLPPHIRRSSGLPVGQGSLMHAGGQSSQPRSQPSQPSQQSFSQGISSQHGTFSQLSQDDHLTNDQKFSSQERENSVRRISALAPVSYSKEESQIPISRSSSNLTRRWSCAPAPQLDHRCQISEELEHRIAMVETSLNRFSMSLDSMQSDIIQINKGTKELLLVMEGIRQKLIAHDDSILSLNRGQEDIRASLDIGFKSVTNQLSKGMGEDRSQDILLAVSTLPERIEASVLTLKEELGKHFSGQLQAITHSLKNSKHKRPSPAVVPPKVTSCDRSRQMTLIRGEPSPLKVSKQAAAVTKVETGSWRIVKSEQVSLSSENGTSFREDKQRRVDPIEQGREDRVVIELDNDTDGDFPCFLVDYEPANPLVNEADEETQQILRKARRRKRKQRCKNFLLPAPTQRFDPHCYTHAVLVLDSEARPT